MEVGIQVGVKRRGRGEKERHGNGGERTKQNRGKEIWYREGNKRKDVGMTQVKLVKLHKINLHDCFLQHRVVERNLWMS